MHTEALKITTVMKAFDTDVATTIQEGNFDLVRRNAFAWRDIIPVFVDSEKKSYRNNPIIRLRA